MNRKTSLSSDSNLLKVTVVSTSTATELRIEGCVTGREAKGVWRKCQRRISAGARLKLDLSGVTLLDEFNVKELRKIISKGAVVVNASLLVSSLLTEEE